MGSEMTAREQLFNTIIKFGSLVNSVLIIGGGLYLLYQRGADEANINRSIEANAAEIVRYAQRSDDRWAAHDIYHRDRLAEVKRVEGETAERFKGIDQRLEQIPQHQFRITALETQMQSMNTFMNDTRRDLGTLVTSMKLVEQAIVNMEAREAAPQRPERR